MLRLASAAHPGWQLIPSIAVGVCLASIKAAATKVLDVVLGQDRREKLDVCILGDDVSKLKPNPLIYTTATERLSIGPSKCVVVEDSLVRFLVGAA